MAVEPSIKRPVLLRLGMILSLGAGAVAVVSAILAGAGVGNFSRLRETTVDSWALPIWAICLVFGALLLAIAFGIRDRKRWARPFILAFWLLEGALNVIGFMRSGQAR